MKNNEDLANEIMNLLDTENKSVRDRLEIIANMLILEGMRGIPPECLPETVSPRNLMTVVLDLKTKFGETIDMAMIHQGLVLLMWLEK